MPRKHLVMVMAAAGLVLLGACSGPPSAPLVQPAAGAQVVQEQPQAVASVKLATADLPGLGKVLTDQNGHTLYLFTKDTKNPPSSTCGGECAVQWPPLMATGDVQVNGVDPALVGRVTRPDGSEQVTVGGWPLYSFAQDTAPGQANGQGVKDVWFAATPAGKKADTPGAVSVVATDIPGFGAALTDQNGRTLYLFTKDSKTPPKSACDGTCAENWPPLIATGDVKLTGVDPSIVGRVTRADGTQQVTVGNWPVYAFTGDTKPGQTNGHGAMGVWFAIEAAGCKSSAPIGETPPPANDSPAEGDGGTGY